MWSLMLLACGLLPGEVPVAPSPAPSPATVAEPSVGVEPTEPRYAGSHILIAWSGAVQAPAGTTRSEQEARLLAEQLRARAERESFEELARSHSDDPSGRRGGSLGVWLTGTMVPDFERAIAAIQPGELGPIVRTPFGWHVIRRDAIHEVEIAHIQIAFQGALRADTSRTRDEALASIQAVAGRLAAGEDFAAIARELSDDSSGAAGGELGRIARGQMMPAFEDAAFALDPGATSPIVETPYGFHLLRRLR
jgi:peptidyl-prolyl cis-trans isomerase SurA